VAKAQPPRALRGTESLEIEYRSITDFKPNPLNARTHSKVQIRQIAESIRAFGFTNPVLIDRHNKIIAGHGRVEAAKLIGKTQVPTIRLESLTEDQVRAYIIADNKLAENAGWDRDMLAIELQHLMTLECADFDVTITGFEMAEIDAVIDEANGPKDEDPVPMPDIERPAISKPGDLWLLGKHRILCGNSLQAGAYQTLMGKRLASMVFCDPPYNVRIDGNVGGKGSIHHREFAMASGEMSEAEFFAFIGSFCRILSRSSTQGSVHFICMDWRHVADLIGAALQSYDELLNICVWVKDNGGMGSFYRSRHELVLVFRNGKGSHRNNIQLGQFGRNRTNVWEYPCVNTFSKQGDEGNLLAMHPTVKPVAMVADAILDCSTRGEIVLDAFLGSGTTLMAAERVGRVCYGIELDPAYVDVAVRRWQKYTGETAVHAVSRKRFDEIATCKRAKHE
jgi:DNA modification methylase